MNKQQFAPEVDGIPEGEEHDPNEMPEVEKKEVHAKAMRRWGAAKKAWESAHKLAVNDEKFADGEQWDEGVSKARQSANLSTLTYNQIPSKYKYIVNNARRAVPAIKVNPVSNGASKNTARVFDGIVKHTQYKFNAKHSYIHALTNAVVGGLGAWKVLPIEIDGEFDIEVQRILDPTSVYIDPSAIKQDFSDADYAFISSWMPRDTFEAEYGKEEDGFSTGTNKGMFTAESVQILEYWVKNHSTGFVEQYVINGTKILTANRAYKGKYLPIVLLTGEEKFIAGERKYKGIVRDIKDMQILLNLVKSQIADWAGRASAQQWLIETDMMEGYEEIWLKSNVSGASVLPYKATGAGGPQRLDPLAPPTGFLTIAQDADQDIRSAVGIRDPLEAIPGNIASKTVEMQISQSNIGTFEYIDKWKDAIKYTGCIIVDLIPHYFNYPHIREIMGIDDQVSTVQLNAPYEENGEQVMHDLTVGKYSVTISDGPSYESQRSEASEKLMECAKVYPEFMQLAGDIVFRNMDFDGASEIADRLRAQIPPNILAASSSSNGDSAKTQNQLQQAVQQLNQLQQENQQLHQFLQQAQQEKATEAAKIQEKMNADLALERERHANAKELKLLDIHAQAGLESQKGRIASNQKLSDHSSALERDLLKNRTDIFIEEIKHQNDPTEFTQTPNMEF